MSVSISDTPECARALNTLAREQMKQRLLADILVDLQVCELEGWDKLEYINELYTELERWAKCMI